MGVGAYAGEIGGAIGGLTGLYGAWEQGQAIQARSTIAQRMAAATAALQMTQANQALSRGTVQADRSVAQGQRQAGTIATAASAGGLDASYGSPNATASYALQTGAMEAMVAKNNAALAAFGYNTAAVNTTANASYEASAAQYQAGSTLLTGGMRAAQDMFQGWAADARMANYRDPRNTSNAGAYSSGGGMQTIDMSGR